MNEIKFEKLGDYIAHELKKRGYKGYLSDNTYDWIYDVDEDYVEEYDINYCTIEFKVNGYPELVEFYRKDTVDLNGAVESKYYIY